MAEVIASNESNLNLEKILWIAVVFSTVFIPFLMILIALVHIDGCPHQPYLPVVVLMAGISMSLSNVVNTADKYSPPKQTSYKKRKRIVGTVNAVINCLTIASFIVACLWIYGKGKPSAVKSSPHYCSPTLYQFSFWLLNLTLIFIALIITVVLIGSAINYWRKKS